MMSHESIDLVSLSGSLQPLIKHFNNNKGLRFLTLLSPTGPGGRNQGARAVRKSIIEEFPNIESSISIVWINMLPSDSEASAKGAATIFSKHPVRQFYDPNQYSGKAIAESIGWSGKVAWDIYLFYLKDSEWVESPPIPAKWMHRLREDWADPRHFCTDDDLVKELYKTMRSLSGLQKSDLGPGEGFWLFPYRG